MKNKKKCFRLLIVDDEPDITELLSYNFRKKGYEVVTAANGFSGLKNLQQVNPDLIILDLMMPHVNGITMCQMIKEDVRYRHIPVFILSATSNEQLIQSAMDAGGDSFISKPVHMSRLISMVDQYRENH